MARKTTGVVRWFDGSKGYGYIDAKDGEEVFVHHSELTQLRLPLLMEGDQVGFFLKETVQGPQAFDVHRLN